MESERMIKSSIDISGNPGSYELGFFYAHYFVMKVEQRKKSLVKKIPIQVNESGHNKRLY